VWENTPGFGEAPFLDTLWSAIDEVIVLPWCANKQQQFWASSSGSRSVSNTSSQQQVLLSSTEQQRYL
jgi:hypothetical protein